MIHAAPPPHHPAPPAVVRHHGWRDDRNFNRDRLYFNGGRWDYTHDYLDVDQAWWNRNTQWIVLENGEHLWRAPSGALLRVHLHR